MDQPTLDAGSMDLLFRQARTHNAWQDRPVEQATLEAMWDLLKWGPTSSNLQPLRVLFLVGEQAKQKLKPALSEGNRAKTMRAPAVAVLAWDSRFYEHAAEVSPGNPGARSRHEGPGKEAGVRETAFRNSSLQGGYLILAARAVGLDCGPMSGFDAAMVEALFFGDGRYRVNFICNLGYGDPAGLRPRNPRLRFDQACQIL